jgi:hypothetical protein
VKEEEVEVGMAAAADSQHASFLFEIPNNKISRGTLPTGSHLKGMSSTREPTDTDRPARLGGALPITLVKQALMIAY